MSKIQGGIQIERSLDRLWEYKDAGTLEPSIELMWQLGHTAAVIDFILEPDNYYIPNVRCDRLVRPKRVGSDAIAIVPVARDTNYVSDDPIRFHRLQRAALLNNGYTNLQLDDMESDMLEDLSITAIEGAAVSAAVKAPIYVPREGKRKGRAYAAFPTMIYHLESRHRAKPTMCPGALMHEMVHVAQFLQEPDYDASQLLNHELAAYAVQAAMLHDLDVEYTYNMAMAQTVDAFRIKNLGKLCYESTDDFEAKVREDPCVSKILR